MGKHTDALGTIENFTAPWETPAGEVEIEKPRLKTWIFNLLSDKAKAQDARDETAESVTQLEKDLADAKADVAKGDSTGKIAELQTKLDKATATAKKAQGDLDRLEVGIEKGLTPKQAARLQGETREELEADADEILETFGVQKPASEDEDEDEDEGEEADDEVVARRSPRLVNSADPKLNQQDAEVDYDKAAAEIMTRRIF